MNKKALIIEDDPNHFELFEKGIVKSVEEFELLSIDIKDLITWIKEDKLISNLPPDIDLFIIDVSLGNGRNELGLLALLKIQNDYRHNFKYIVSSIWDRSEFSTEIEIEDLNFINKNNFMGFELWIKTRNTINLLWKK